MGSVTLGLIIDATMTKHKRLPLLTWAQRKEVPENLVGVDEVIAQNGRDYAVNIRLIKPNFLVHGDNWDSEPTYLKHNAVQALSEYGGKLLEVP